MRGDQSSGVNRASEMDRHRRHSQRNMQIFVETATNPRRISVNANYSDTVRSLKAKLWDMEGLAPDRHFLVFAGELMDDDRTLRSHGVRDGHTLYIFQGTVE
ncbi:hypothetical protein AMTRI_Chr07g29590 [Amborella trichopoda]|uniref:Ubiquitin-like domain-containing protein n=1 Tax=Amborella trichopoda TaxID=13333 RepID=W1NI89_AMBTC|nr:hypothetical protein AMTR_s00009p00161810 [Amborella trichopoda]